MKEIKINIKTVNDAFIKDEHLEIKRILKELIETGIQEQTLHDINGNRVGKVTIKEG